MTDTATTLTFEQGYARLRAIAERVTSDEVPVAEMCDLFAEGKGLERSLTDYLNEQKGRVEAIERGDGVQSFRIAAVADAPPPEPTSAPGNVADPFVVTKANGGSPAPQGSDDDIPF